MNLVELIDRYNSDAKCREELARLRWPTGIACLRVWRSGPFGASRRRQVAMCFMRLPVHRYGGHNHASLAPSAPQVVPEPVNDSETLFGIN